MPIINKTNRLNHRVPIRIRLHAVKANIAQWPFLFYIVQNLVCIFALYLLSILPTTLITSFAILKITFTSSVFLMFYKEGLLFLEKNDNSGNSDRRLVFGLL